MNTHWAPLPVDEAQARVNSSLEAVLHSSVHAKRLFAYITQHRKSWALVGGAPRNWATRFPEEPNDLDVVVGSDQGFVDELVAAWCRDYDSGDGVAVSRTRFGGYRLLCPSVSIDIWAAPATVSVAKGWTDDSNIYRAVAKSAALSLDSLVVTSRGTVYERGFFETLSTGVLRLNHCYIDGEELVARKAVRLCSAYGLMPDLSIQNLILAHLGSQVIAQLFGRDEKSQAPTAEDEYHVVPHREQDGIAGPAEAIG